MQADCNDDALNAPLVYSSKFDRVALMSNKGRPGWVDTTGKFTPAGQQPSTPDFGDRVEVHLLGFDRLDNFYTQTEINDDVQLYRTPAGSTAPGELVPKTDGQLGRLPGGLIGYGAQRYVFSGCSNGVETDGDFDPDKRAFFYERNGVIFRDAQFCNNSGEPLTVKANLAIAQGMASNQDQSKLAFIGGSKLYLVDTSIGGVPNEVVVTGGSIEYSTIRAWLP